MTAPSTPRVAASIDDLRVGQVVAWQEKTGDWQITARPLDEDNDPQNPDNWEWMGTEIIVDEVLPEPVTVSREAFDRLARDVAEVPDNSVYPALLHSARALVDEVRADR